MLEVGPLHEQGQQLIRYWKAVTLSATELGLGNLEGTGEISSRMFPWIQQNDMKYIKGLYIERYI
jgi:hypothetical protein